MRVPFVDLRAQHEDILEELNSAQAAVLSTSDFILGAELEAFEEEFSRYCGVAHAVGVDSGTSAIELALRAFGIGPGDEVITAANTFIATALAISHVGATPVLVDVDRETLTIDPEAVAAAVTPRTRAVIPVHLYGHPAAMDDIVAIAEQHGFVVIEDACQAHGARYKGRRAGSLGDAAAFSFYPSKNLGCWGDGGAVTTQDDAAADLVRRLRNYGQRDKHRHEIKGFNRRLDTLQAAVLRVKLRHLDRWNQRRREHAARYAELLGRAEVQLPATAGSIDHVWHVYAVQHRDRDRLARDLRASGIATGVHYPTPIHLQDAYRELGRGPGSLPHAERAASRTLSLPMFAELSAPEIEQVAAAVRRFAAAPRPRAA
jgi:dTDP-4-amino-4,6-dideoxygalactose transaminase